MSIRLLAVVLVFCCFICAAQAQEYHSFRELSLRDGLSQSSVQTIFQDSRGFIWLGTQDGLNLYDGYIFTYYRHDPEDDNSLSSNDIAAICEDSSGMLWIGTAEGLNRLDPVTGEIKRYYHDPDDRNSPPDDAIYSLLADSEGYIWIGTDLGGVNRFEPKTSAFTYYSDPGNELTWQELEDRLISSDEETLLLDFNLVIHFLEDSNGDIWACSTPFSIQKLDKKTNEFIAYNLPEEFINSDLGDDELIYQALYESQKGGFIFGAGGHGLFRFDTREGRFKILSETVNDYLIENKITITSLVEDDTGCLWIGTYGGGLICYDSSKERFKVYNSRTRSISGINSDYILSLYRDMSGLVWAGTIDIGAVRIRKEKFGRYTYDPFSAESLPSRMVNAIFEGSEGELWIGHLDGMVRIDRETGKFKTYEELTGESGKLTLQEVHFILEDSATSLLIGGDPFGLIRFDKKTERYQTILENEQITKVLSHEDGSLWIAAGWAGVLRLLPDQHDPEVITFGESAEQMPFVFAQDLAFDSAGNLWIASENGLYRYNPATQELQGFVRDPGNPKSLKSNDILCLQIATDGTLWVGASLGLHRMDRDTGGFSHFTRDDGLPNNIINAILQDDSGDLWISTNGGLSRFNPETETFTNFDERDGLQSREFNQGVAFKSSSGEMFFGGVGGLNIFHPSQVKKSLFSPTIVITGINAGDIQLGRDIFPEQKQLEFSYSQRDVRIQFAGLDYALPKGVHYQFILEGYESSWRSSGDLNFANYTNLPPGSFTFRVKCTNSDGRWGGKETSIRFMVLPPWWDSWWFRLLSAVVILAIVLTVVFSRERRNRRQRDELRKQVADRTAELAEQNKTLEEYQHHLEELVDRRTSDLKDLNLQLQEEVDFRKRVENELRVYQRNLHDLSHHMQTVIENEKTEIARDVHDEIGQALTGLKYILSWLKKSSFDSPGDVQPKIERGLEILADSIKTVKQISTRLRPAILTDMGLSAAIEWYAQDFQERTSISVRVECEPEDIRPEAGVSTTLFRIFQEALTNVARHAHAQHVDARLVQEDDIIALTVADDGRGITRDDRERKNSFGLIGIEERVKYLNGTFEVQGQTGQGTTLTANIPFSEQAMENSR